LRKFIVLILALLITVFTALAGCEKKQQPPQPAVQPAVTPPPAPAPVPPAPEPAPAPAPAKPAKK
jgi:hypothetical protein